MLNHIRRVLPVTTLLGLITAAALSIASCSSAASHELVTSTGSGSDIVRVSIGPRSTRLLVGDSLALVAYAHLRNGDSAVVAAAWFASRGSISTNGWFYADQRGVATVRGASLSDPSLTDSTAIEVGTIELMPDDTLVNAGSTIQVNPRVVSPDGSVSTPEVTWSADGGSISATGVYSAPADSGTYLVSAQVIGHVASASVRMKVKPATLKALVLNPSALSLVAGASEQFSLSALWSNGSTTVPTITWSATGGTVTSTGLFTAGLSAGSFRVIAAATADGQVDTSAVTITVPPPTLTQLALSPKTVTLAAGGTQQLGVSGTWSDGSTNAPGVTYSATGGTITASGVYTAATTPGTYHVIANQTGGTKADTATVTISVPVATLIALVLNPTAITLAPGGTQQFGVAAAWSDGSTAVPAVTYSAGGGTISAGGLYLAGATPGTYRMIATQQGGTKADTATVSVAAVPPTLTALTIAPKSVTVASGSTQSFGVAGTWSDGSKTVPQATYTATGGTISATGLYTAGTTPGAYRVIAAQQGGAKADTASVTVVAPPPTLTKLTIAPKTVTVATNGVQQFTISGTWSDGSTTVPQATYVATGGTITASGLYSAGTTAGTFRVIATQQGGTKADTATIVIPAPPLQPLAPSTYYVSTSGNDAKDGSFTSPWRTVAHACAAVTPPGSVIHVNTGTYLETAQCNLAVGVTLEGDGPTSVIKAGYTPDTNPVHALIALVSASEGTNGNQSVRQLAVDGNALTGYSAMYVRARSNVAIHDVTVRDFRDHGVTFNGRADEAATAPGVYAIDNQFYNNTVTNSSTYSGYGRGVLQIGGQDGMLIHDNTMSQVGRATGTNGYVIKSYLDGYLKNVKIYGNTITKQAYDGVTYDFAIELWHIVGGVEVYNNTIIGNTDLDYLSKGADTFSVSFHNNVIGPTSQQANVEHGLELEEGCSDVIIGANYFKNLEVGIQIQTNSMHGSTTYNHISIYGNIFDGMGKTTGTSGTSLNWSGDGTATVSDINIWNNTAYGRYSTATDGFRIDGVGAMSSISIRNNIVVGFARSPVHMYLNNAGATISIVSIENNDFFGNGNGNVYLTQGITPTGVTNHNNMTANPLFVSTTDLHLQATSPATNIGAYGTIGP